MGDADQQRDVSAMSDTYQINEIFYSLQGEGAMVGTPYVFVRFSGCNLTCKRATEGFDCDTEFTSGKGMTTIEILEACAKAIGILPPFWVCLTGGEPLLQVDAPLVQAMRLRGLKVAMETNGTRLIPEGAEIDWLCVSPKTAEHTVELTTADEVKYVRHEGQEIPRTTVEAGHYLISPAWSDDWRDVERNIKWCINLVKANPRWRLSIQTHKILGLR
jgi:organic radical activating enzyme